jgi:hypothetical protein
VTADEAFDGIDGIFGIYDRLPLRGLTDESFAVFILCDNRGAESAALRGRDHGRRTAFHDCNNGVGRAQVNANDFAHTSLLSMTVSNIFNAHILPVECKKTVNGR